MEDCEIIEKARSLTYPFYLNEETDNDYYVTKDRNSTEGDFCSDCIDHAVKDYRKEYLLDQRKRPIDPDKEGLNELGIWRDNEFSEFDYMYESDREDNNFLFCDICGKMLKVCFFLDSQEMEHWESVEIDKSDHDGYELLSILDCYPTGESEMDLRLVELAKRVIEIYK